MRTLLGTKEDKNRTELVKYEKVKKTQIVLCHTSRDIDNYLISLESRFNGKYDKLPSYIIDKSGEITNLYPKEEYRNFLGEEDLDKQSVIICLENRGWLRRRNNDGKMVDWIGSIYEGEIIEKKWRGHYFWEPYTIKQIESLLKLINEVCDDLNIRNDFIGHNVLYDGIEHHKGIVCRSNYGEYWTELSPAFNFNTLIKKEI